MTKARVFIAGLILAALGIWFWRVELFLLVRDGFTGDEVNARLVGFGPAVIRPLIKDIRKHGSWYRQHGSDMKVLSHFGEPAHRQLLEAIDHETNRRAQAYLIYALQGGFEDYSRFGLWLKNYDPSENGANFEMATFGWVLAIRFPEAPPLAVDVWAAHPALNPEFIGWWESRQAAR